MKKKPKPTVDPKKFPSNIRKVMSGIHKFDMNTETGRAMQKLWEAHLESQAKALAKHPPKLAKISRKMKKKLDREIRELRKGAQKKPRAKAVKIKRHRNKNVA